MFNPATLLFAVVLLAPSMLMRIADDRPERSGARAVLLCNVAAGIEPFCRLWEQLPPTMSHALSVLSASVVARAWLAAGLGWLVSEALIFLAVQALAKRDARALQSLQAEIKSLVDEWGRPAAGSSSGGRT